MSLELAYLHLWHYLSPYPATDGAHPCAGPASFGARHGQKRSASATAASQVAWPP